MAYSGRSRLAPAGPPSAQNRICHGDVYTAQMSAPDTITVQPDVVLRTKLQSMMTGLKAFPKSWQCVCTMAGMLNAADAETFSTAWQRTHVTHQMSADVHAWCLCACAVLRRVKEAAVQGRQHGSGSVRQALCAALQEEITDFYRLMAVLEAQLAAPMPLPGGCLQWVLQA